MPMTPTSAVRESILPRSDWADDSAGAAKTALARRAKPSRRSGVDELGRDPRGQQASGVATVEQALHGGAARFAVVARPLVDVHADTAVGAGAVVLHAPGIPRGVVERLLAALEPAVDALAQQPAEQALGLFGEVAADAVGAQRQRAAGLFLPPGAEVDDGVGPLLAVGER